MRHLELAHLVLVHSIEHLVGLHKLLLHVGVAKAFLRVVWRVGLHDSLRVVTSAHGREHVQALLLAVPWHVYTIHHLLLVVKRPLLVARLPVQVRLQWSRKRSY